MREPSKQGGVRSVASGNFLQLFLARNWVVVGCCPARANALPGGSVCSGPAAIGALGSELLTHFRIGLDEVD